MNTHLVKHVAFVVACTVASLLAFVSASEIAGQVPASTLTTPASPEKAIGADGFIQRWLLLEPISANGLTDSAVQAAVKKEYFPGQFTAVPREMRDVRLSIGSNAASVWWVNGKEVIGIYGDRQTVIDDGASSRLTLNKGQNVVGAAIVNGGGATDFCARFLDPEDKPLKEITVSLGDIRATPSDTRKQSSKVSSKKPNKKND